MLFFPRALRLLSAGLPLVFTLPVTIGLVTAPSLHAQDAEPISLSISPSVLSRVYDGQAVPIDPATDLTISPGSLEDYTIKITYSGKTAAPQNAGTYTVKVVATTKTKPARSATATATLEIQKVPLLVTADDQVRLFGMANPKFTLSFDGFVNGETPAVLKKRPKVTTTAKTNSPAGIYEITVSGGAETNYSYFGYNPGQLTIIPAFPGTYEAIFNEFGVSGVPVGKLTVTLPAKGAAFTARLDIAAESQTLPFSGKLVPDAILGGAVGVAERKNSNGDLYRLTIEATESGVSATLHLREKGDTEDIQLVEIPDLARTETSSKTISGDLAGAYTLALLNPYSSDFDPLSPYPAGLGFANASINAKGTLKLTGLLPDGSKLTASLQPDAHQTYRLYFRPYGARANSYAAATLPLVPHIDIDRADRFYVPVGASSLYLTKARKPSGKLDALFPEGFGIVDFQLALDPWLPPAKAKSATRKTEAVRAFPLAERLGLVNHPADAGFAEIDFGDYLLLGSSAFELPEKIEVTAANKILPVLAAPPANPRSWKIKSLNINTGRFTGTFVLQGYDYFTFKDYKQTLTFQGILRQPPPGDNVVGAGYFIVKPIPDAWETETKSSALRFFRTAE